MNISLSLDRGCSPVRGDFNKENVTTLDKTELILASPSKSFTSPSKFATVRQITSPRQRQPLEDQDPNSQDSGYAVSFEDVKSNFRFAEPFGLAPRKSSIEPSPRKELTPSPQSKLCSLNPVSLYSRSSSSEGESVDDGFLEFFMSEKMDEDAQLPSGMNSLLSGSIHVENSSTKCSTPNSPHNDSLSDSPFFLLQGHGSSSKGNEFQRPSFRRCLSSVESFTPASSRVSKVRSCLFKSTTVVRSLDQNLENSPNPTNTNESPVSQLASSALFSLRLSNSGSFKRPDPPSDKQSPIQNKRRKSLHNNQENEVTTSPKGTLLQYGFQKTSIKATVKLQRCFSESEATIKSALTRSFVNPDLIGDFSKPFALPLMEGRHQDLKSISVDTLASLIRGEFVHQIGSYTIVDCRYPYEYEGGHIRGAKNYFTKEQIVKEFVKSKEGVSQQSDSSCLEKRNILIFHCEFSSERGPTLSRFLRNSDRDLNKECYPALDYPEMYLLNGGYKLFYERYQDLCEPQSYLPMMDPKHESDLRKFRSKSKSWNSGDGKNRLYPRNIGLKRLGL